MREDNERSRLLVLEVVREFTFDAAHFLPGHPGKCAAIHGHTWRLQVGVRGTADAISGMVLDFADLAAIVRSVIIDKIDHSNLNLKNDVLRCGFPDHQPTAEYIVQWVVETLLSKLRGLCFVRLYESAESYVEWRDARHAGRA